MYGLHRFLEVRGAVDGHNRNSEDSASATDYGLIAALIALALALAINVARTKGVFIL